jgi:dihydropteroate synthase
VATFLRDRAERAEAAGIPRQRVIVDAGCDLGKTWQQSLALLRHSDALASMGWPLLLSASNKTFLGKLLDLDIKDRREASHSAHALGILKGCRILRAHDVAGAKRVVDVLSAVLSA